MKMTVEYDQPYFISRREQLPKDFPVDADFEQLTSALFLPPRRHAKLKGITYPARILLLFPKRVIVVWHPTTKMRPVTVRLDEIVIVEQRRLFPDAMITIQTTHTAEEWAYQVQAEGILGEFLSQLRAFLLKEEPSQPSVGRSIFGEPLDYKFGCGESDILDRGETLVARFFSAASNVTQKRWFFRTSVPIAGEYLAVSSRRVVWLSGRIDGVYEPKGMTSSYVPLRHIDEIRFIPQDKICEIQFDLGGNVRWRVPIQPDFYDEAASFTKQVQRFLSWHRARKGA